MEPHLVQSDPKHQLIQANALHQYTVTGAVELTVPAFQKAGDYTSTLVVTLT